MAKYVNQMVYIADLDRVPIVPFAYAMANKSNKATIDKILYDATGQPALYTSGKSIRSCGSSELLIIYCYLQRTNSMSFR